MPCFISFRDVNFTPSLTGVRIIVITDVPSHIFIRLSAIEPEVHKKASFRRGIYIREDLRFCFVVYDDIEQFEAGDTTIHTFWLSPWAVCVTKWFYFWGIRAGVTCTSTSPIFHYHNNGVGPVPPPDTMFQINELDPEYLFFSSTAGWVPTSLLYESFSPDCTGVLIQFIHTTTGARSIGFRKPGVTVNFAGLHSSNSIHWIFLGLDASKQYEYYLEPTSSAFMRVMGYTGRNVVYLDTPISIKPSVAGIYSQFDISASCPNAKLVFTVLRLTNAFPRSWSIRPVGSSKDMYYMSNSCYPIAAVSPAGLIETKLSAVGVQEYWWIYGYIKEDCTTSQNGVDIAPALNSGVWNTRLLGAFPANTRFGILELAHPSLELYTGVRKSNGLILDTRSVLFHTTAVTHLSRARYCDIYTNRASTICKQIAGVY